MDYIFTRQLQQLVKSKIMQFLYTEASQYSKNAAITYIALQIIDFACIKRHSLQN